ncbi:hypothetical protein ACFHYQ_13475 [Sphaerimonospora cavernae]|uniref:N-acetyltransferase domain-containing protein n=1 Tax=Sphaerimonospora cavernae TaxID=1740611 RepID=A0ABV6U5Y1_9ACTN
MNEFDIRRPDRADAMAVHELVAEHDAEVIGKPDWTFQDIADTLAEIDLANDAWVLHAGDRMVGWGYAQRKGMSDNVDIDVQARDPEAADLLWDMVRAAAGARGFEPATGFHRMRIDHQGVEWASLPGVTVDRGAPGRDDPSR